MNKYEGMELEELDVVSMKVLEQLEAQVNINELDKSTLFDIVVEQTGSSRLAGLTWFNLQRRQRVAKLGIKLEL